MQQKSLKDYWNISTPIKPEPILPKNAHRLPILINKQKSITIELTRCGSAVRKFLTYLNDLNRKDAYFYHILDTPQAHHVYHWFVRDMPHWTETYFNRLANEFKLIEEKKFWNVFEQVRQIMEWIGTNMPHVIRGSSGSSLTCYLMGITDFDPIEHQISLARFMHELREDIPDIDIDVPAHLRLGLYRRIFTEWRGRVARISNHLYFREKSAIREAIRRHGHHKQIPKDVDLTEIFPEPSLRQDVAEMAHDLLGTFRGYSLHCGGIVVFPGQVPEKYFLGDWKLGQEEWGPQIHLNKDEVEDENLIKIDILSNRGLSQIYELCPNKPLCDYPTDNRVWELFSNGDTLGITYAETPAMKKVYMALKPKNLGDLALGLALIRPAASGRGQKASFLTHWNGKEFVGEEECPFPTNERPWLIYDDDAIQWISRWIHCSEAVADKYRKAFAKGKRKIQLEFAAKLRKLQPQWNDKQHHWVINQLNQLQEYSFCKSHAYSYAQLVYALGYWKVNDPKRFWWATLRHSHSSYRLWVHVRAAIEVGLKGGGGRGPWELSEDGITLIPKEMIQKKLIQEDDWTDFNRHGVWWGEQFLSGLYERWEEKIVYFKGLVATGRVYVPERNIKNVETHVDGFSQEGDTYQKSKYITFLTIGTGKGLLRDLVLWGCYRVAGIRIVEGYGDWIDGDTPWIQVRKVKVCHH